MVGTKKREMLFWAFLYVEKKDKLWFELDVNFEKKITTILLTITKWLHILQMYGTKPLLNIKAWTCFRCELIVSMNGSIWELLF